jgi:hypothetical protein
MGNGEAWVNWTKIIVGVLMLLGVAASVRSAELDAKDSPDCGLNALFLLLKLEQHPVSLGRIGSMLPQRQTDGYSMTELATASAKLGLELEGVRFAQGDRPLDGAAIAFFRNGQNGHFAVLRPVGTTGTMVQVIDPPRAPWIADYERVVSGTTWTGRILVRRGAWMVRNQVPLLMALAGCVLLTLGMNQRLRIQSSRMLRITICKHAINAQRRERMNT